MAPTVTESAAFLVQRSRAGGGVDGDAGPETPDSRWVDGDAGSEMANGGRAHGDSGSEMANYIGRA
jgi:hypothetical protein